MATVSSTVWEMFIVEEVEYDPDGLIRVQGDVLTLEEWNEWKHVYANYYNGKIYDDYLGWGI